MTVVRWNRENGAEIVDRIMEEFGKDLPVIIPTDTLYGLAGPVSNRGALEAIFARKNRPRELSLPVAAGALYMIDDMAKVHRWQKTTLRDNLPGPVTFILRPRRGSIRW